MDLDRTILILSGYFCGIFASVFQGSQATFVFFAVAFALDLFWSSWFVPALLLIAIIATAALQKRKILDSSAKLVVLGILGAMTTSMWHQKTWFCATVRGDFTTANLGTPFLFGFFSHNAFLGKRKPIELIFHLIVSVQLFWLLTPAHDIWHLHDVNVMVLAGTGFLSMLFRDALLTLLTVVPTMLFVLYMAYVSPTSNPSSNRGAFPGGAKLTTFYFFVIVVHSLCS